jgi:putative FmdB family regulatory protein
MALYEYSCHRCGRFDVQLPMGTAPAECGCPVCSGTARRVYSPPALKATSSAIAGVREQDERSRETPSVVSEVPSAGGRPADFHPGALRPEVAARLPRS